MDALQFCYWLKGHFELRRAEVGLSDKQVDIIQDHLNLVFNKVTPDRSVDKNKEDLINKLNDLEKPYTSNNKLYCYKQEPTGTLWYIIGEYTPSGCGYPTYQNDLLKYTCMGSC